MAAQPIHPLNSPHMAVLGKNEYLTFQPEFYEWTKGEVRFRLMMPSGQNTDLASAPWWARAAGFKKEDVRWHRASKAHDLLYFHIKLHDGILPAGWYQYLNPISGQWENVNVYQWKRKEADDLFLKIMLEDGFPEGKARLAYFAVRTFGGIHMRFN